MKGPADMLASQMPPVTVLICTRDRGDSIVATIRSVLACIYPDLSLVIIDQSDDQHTARAISACRADPRLRYISTGVRGKSRAVNVGLAFVRTEIVLLTDDDCEVPPSWVHEMVQPFLRHPQVGVVFCDVAAGPHDQRAGFIPVSLSSRSVLVEDLARWQTCDGVNIGIGAGMAIRRSAAIAIGGFSLLFGPGSPFRSGDDLEFALHALAAGYQIYRTNRAAVIHHGFRTYAQGRQLVYRNLFGIGGIYGQLLRRRPLIALRYYAAVFASVVIVPALTDIAHRQLPRKLGRAFWLLYGFAEGLCTAPPPPAQGLSGVPATQ